MSSDTERRDPTWPDIRERAAHGLPVSAMAVRNLLADYDRLRGERPGLPYDTRGGTRCGHCGADPKAWTADDVLRWMGLVRSTAPRLTTRDTTVALVAADDPEARPLAEGTILECETLIRVDPGRPEDDAMRRAFEVLGQRLRDLGPDPEAAGPCIECGGWHAGDCPPGAAETDPPQPALSDADREREHGEWCRSLTRDLYRDQFAPAPFPPCPECGTAPEPMEPITGQRPRDVQWFRCVSCRAVYTRAEGEAAASRRAVGALTERLIAASEFRAGGVEPVPVGPPPRYPTIPVESDGAGGFRVPAEAVPTAADLERFRAALRQGSGSLGVDLKMAADTLDGYCPGDNLDDARKLAAEVHHLTDAFVAALARESGGPAPAPEPPDLRCEPDADGNLTFGGRLVFSMETDPTMPPNEFVLRSETDEVRLVNVGGPAADPAERLAASKDQGLRTLLEWWAERIREAAPPGCAIEVTADDVAAFVKAGGRLGPDYCLECGAPLDPPAPPSPWRKPPAPDGSAVLLRTPLPQPPKRTPKSRMADYDPPVPFRRGPEWDVWKEPVRRDGTQLEILGDCGTDQWGHPDNTYRPSFPADYEWAPCDPPEE